MPTSNAIRHAILLAFGLIGQAATSADLPSGGTVVGGAATIDQSGASQVITQTTAKAVINWNNFSIGVGNSVRINQLSSSSVLLNRVTGNNRSEILGNLSSNGQVFLVNPLGIYFGAGATVDVGGLVATTMNISNDDFMAGRYTFSRDNTLAARQEVINQGVIKARENGYVVLAGDYAANRGAIEARFGTAALASGSKMTLDVQGDSLINFAVDEKTVTALSGVDNIGQILADGGKAIMTAAVATNLTTAVVNNSGLIRAGTTVERDGAIYLSADGGNTQVSGTLDASGTGTGQKGGSIQVLGANVALTDNAVLNASGNAGGGKINVGGNYQGTGPLQNASNTYIGKDVKINSDALVNGKGGDVVIWANNKTEYHGDITARGGVNSGDGGNVEVSGKDYLAFRGTVSTTAANGKTGILLLDPSDYEIVTALSTTPTTDVSQMTVGALETALNANNVTIQTSASGSRPGNITIDDGSGGGVQWNSAHTLTLQAHNNIIIKSAVESNGSGGISFNAQNGAITTDALVRTSSGALQLYANTITTNGNVTTNSGAVTLDSGNSVTNNGTISSNGGLIILDGNQITINNNVNAGGGEVRLNSNGTIQKAGSVITADRLLLTGSGNWDLNGSSSTGYVGTWNEVNTLAASLNGGTLRFSNNKNLRIGSVNGINGINHANGNTQLYLDKNNGAVSIAQTITSNNLYIRAVGGTTQLANSNILANTLGLGGGTVTLENANNNVNTLAADINGALSYRDADTLAIGNASSILGIKTNNNNVTLRTGDSASYNDESLPSATNTASLRLNESINAGSGTVRLTTGKGGVFQRSDTNNGTPLEAGSITAGGLLLRANSTTDITSFVLNNSFNRVGTLAGRTNGSISYTGGALTIGTIDGIAGITVTANKIVGAETDPDTGVVTNVRNDNNISLSIGGDLKINENLTAKSGGSDTVNIGLGGEYTASTASGKKIVAGTLGAFADDGKGTIILKTNVSQLAAGGGKKIVIDNSEVTGDLTAIAIGAPAGTASTVDTGLKDDVSTAAKPVGDFYLTTGGKLNILKLQSKGQNLLLRSTALSILLDASTADGARIMLQPFNANSSIGIHNATEAGFNPGINYDAATLLKFTNPTATFQFGTAQNVILNDNNVDAAAKTTFTGNIHIGKDGAFNLGYRSLSAQTTNNLVAYNVGPLYNLRLVAENLTINGFNTFGNQLHFFTNNLQLPGTAANYINPNKPNITLRPLSNHTIWIGQGLANKPYEPYILPQTLVKLPDGSTIIVSGSTDFAYTSGGNLNGETQHGDIHIPWNNGIVSLGNRKLVLSTGADIYTSSSTPVHTENNDGGKSGGLWQGCQNLATCKAENPPTVPPPDTGSGGSGGSGGGDGTGDTSGDGGSCATCPPAQPDPNYPTPGTTTPDTGTNPGSPNPGTTPGTGTTPDNTDTGDGDGGGGSGGGGNGNGNNVNPNNGTGSGTGNDGGGTGGGGNGNGSGNTADGSGDGGANNGSGGNGNGSGNIGDGNGNSGNSNGSGGTGDGNGDGGAGGGNGTGGNGSGGDGDGSGDGGANNGSGGNGSGTGGNGSGGNGDGNGDGGNGGGSGGASDGDGDGGGSNGSGGTGNGLGDGGSGNGAGETGDGNGDGGNGSGSGGTGNGDGDGGANNGSGGTGDGSGDNNNGNGSGGVSDGNGDDGNNSNPGGNGNGDGDGGAGNGSGGTGDGNGDGGNGRASGGTGDGNGDGDGGNGSGPGGNGGDDGDGGSDNGSGGTSDGNGNGDDDDQSDTSSDTNTPAFDISCDDATEVGKRKERTDQKGRETLVEVTKEGLKLQDPCQQQKKDDSRSR